MNISSEKIRSVVHGGGVCKGCIGWLIPAIFFILLVLFFFQQRKVVLVESLISSDESFLVIGRSSDLINGWEISFCWRFSKEYWAHYYLDHETALWRNVTLRVDAEKVVICRDGRDVGFLNRNDACISLPDIKRVSCAPMRITRGANPLDPIVSIDPISCWEKGWTQNVLSYVTNTIDMGRISGTNLLIRYEQTKAHDD